MKKMITASLFIGAALLMTSCGSKEPEPIAYGKDACAECKMTIMDPKFGGEIVTKKGKIYKFDDTHCIARFLEKETISLGSIHKTFFSNYNREGDWLNVETAEFVVSSQFKSPMGGNAAAFATRAEAEKKAAELPGARTTNWATLYNILIK